MTSPKNVDIKGKLGLIKEVDWIRIAIKASSIRSFGVVTSYWACSRTIGQARAI